MKCRASQIIRDTLGEGGHDSVTKWHMGEGVSQPEYHVSFFVHFELNFTAKTMLLKNKNCVDTPEEVLRDNVSKCHMGLKSVKKVSRLLWMAANNNDKQFFPSNVSKFIDIVKLGSSTVIQIFQWVFKGLLEW